MDVLTKITGEIDERMEKLAPAVAEYGRLEQAKRALSDGNQVRRGASNGAKRKPRRTTRRRRASAEEVAKRDGRILAILKEDPKTKPSALAMMLEVQPATVYARLKRMQSDGLVRKGKAGYRIQEGKAPAA